MKKLKKILFVIGVTLISTFIIRKIKEKINFYITYGYCDEE